MEKSSQSSRSKSDRMYEMLGRYQNSDQTQKEFCKTEGISVGTLQYWQRKYREEKTQTDKSGFHPIRVSTSAIEPHAMGRCIMIRMRSGITIEIPMDL